MSSICFLLDALAIIVLLIIIVSLLESNSDPGDNF